MFSVVAGERSVLVVSGYSGDKVPVPGSGDVFVFVACDVGVLSSRAQVESFGLKRWSGRGVGKT